MEREWKYKTGHIVFWTATILFHMYTRSSLIHSAGVSQFFLEIIVRNILLAGVVYFNLKVLVPHYVRHQRVTSYGILLCASLLAYALLKNVHDVYLFGYILDDDSQKYFFNNTFYNASIALFYLAFSIALELSSEWYEQRETIRRIEVEKLNTELEYLKAQINPHFLFNSINTIYFQIDKQNNSAREMLSSFSDMLRYQLYECNGKEIPIEKEISYLQSYVGMQRMRKNDNCSIGFDSDSNVYGFSIAPLLLIPFVENAFKHVSHHPVENHIHISLSRIQDTFSMTVFNTKEKVLDANVKPGIGLRNVKRRLELVYNGNHKLEIKDDSDRFEVKLLLRITNHL